MMTTQHTIYQVDSFTDTPFKGNPAGVMIVNNDTTSQWMQQVAMEMNLSETAFILPNENEFLIRYFTPLKEVDLCGHATLASAHILYEKGIVSSQQTIRFKAKGGELTIIKKEDWIVMNFPTYPYAETPVHPEFAQIIGFEPIATYNSSYDWLIALARTEEEVQNATPDFGAMAAKGLGHLMITATCHSGKADFVVRCFAPIAGINEDPVTGSAHCALTPFWAQRLGKREMNSIQLSKRTGKLHVKLINDRVEISGKAVTVFEAQLKV